MKLLSKLTPAEILFILKAGDVSFNEILKYTLIDLFLRKALLAKVEHVQAHERDPIRILTYVTKGENSDKITKSHQAIFLNPFYSNPELEMLFRFFIKKAIEQTGGRRNYIKNMVLQSNDINPYFKNSIFDQLFGWYRLNDTGKEIKSQILSEIHELTTTLPDIISSDSAKANEIFNTICGNIFLIDGFEFELTRKLEIELASEVEKYLESLGYNGIIAFPTD